MQSDILLEFEKMTFSYALSNIKHENGRLDVLRVSEAEILHLER